MPTVLPSFQISRARATFAWIAVAVVIALLPRPACTALVPWEVENPLPQPSQLYGVSGTGHNNVIAVGARGTILHFDGLAWSPMSSGTSRSLRAVWLADATHGFAVGESGTILGFDGINWHSMPSGTSSIITSVWGASATDVYAVTYDSSVLHFDGVGWTQAFSGPSHGLSNVLTGVWAAGPTDVFAVGDAGLLLHYDGTTWAASSLTTDWVGAVWGRNGHDVYALSSAGFLHYDGTTWTRRVFENRTYWGITSPGGEGGFLAVGFNFARFDGTSWGTTLYPPPDSGLLTFRAVWSAGANDAFVVGDGNAIYHFDGSALTPMTSGYVGGIAQMWAESGMNVIAAGLYGVILRRQDHHWIVEVPPNYQCNDYGGAIWGSSESDVFASACPGTVQHYDGTRWSTMSTGATAYAESIWGSSASDVYLIGFDGIFHFDGTNWARAGQFGGRSIWGAGPRDIYAAGDGNLMHYDGQSWTLIPATSLPYDWRYTVFSSLWGSGSNDIYACGRGTGTPLYHFDGMQWTLLDVAPPNGYVQDCLRVWGRASNDVYAVIGFTGIYHFDGTSWTLVDTDTGYIWGDPDGDLFLFGGQGLIEAYNPGWLFRDSFEKGSVLAWSGAIP